MDLTDDEREADVQAILGYKALLDDPITRNCPEYRFYCTQRIRQLGGSIDDDRS